MDINSLFLLGIALILIGIGLIIYSSILGSKEVEYGFIGIIGPIPIVISSSREMLILSIVIFIIILFILLIFLRYL